MTDEQLRIRGYLKAQGAKLSPPEIVDKVQAAMGDLMAAAASVPAARFGERPAPGEWSANHVLAHVLAADAYFAGGIASILAGAPPSIREESSAEDAPLRPAREWAELWQRERAALFERVLAADPDGHGERTIEHPMFGPLTWREALLFLRLHDLDHAGQLRGIAAALA